MGLIKSNNAPATLSPFSMKDIETQARAILSRARQQAEQLLIEAQQEAEQLKAAAHVDGRKEGHREGLIAGTKEGTKAGLDAALAEQRTKLTQVVTALSSAVQEVEASRQDLETSALTEVIELAVAIARRVTKRQGIIDPAVLAANISEAMKLVVHSADIRIAIHPTQRQTLTEALPKLQLVWPSLAHVELIDDDSLSPGGCKIFTKQGEIDAGLDGQLDRVVADLMPSQEEAAA
jgi:flagellar assembly protein FliH